MDTTMVAKRKAKEAEGLERQIAVRLTEADYQRLEKLGVHLSVSTIARVALLVELEAIEEDPAVLVGEKPRKR